MKIGVPREIKDRENRVSLTPEGVRQLAGRGHIVLVEADAGAGSGFANGDYQSAGAKIVDTASAWDNELVLKIKEPLESEYPCLKDNLVFTYFHLAGVSPALTDALLKAGTSAVAYETVEDDHGRLPLLAPMSAVAGNMAANIGGYYLAKFNGGKGMQLGQVMGTSFGKAMVIGNGVVGQHAARVLQSMGTKVFVFGRDIRSFNTMQFADPNTLEFQESTPASIARHISSVDLVIGAVLVAGARAQHVVTEDMVKTMQAGSVIVDVSIDQGGCIATSRPTSHTDPVFIQHGVTHYCVTNMPGAYPRTSTIALTNATLPYVIKLADKGYDALRSEPAFGKGLNTHRGAICYQPVAAALGLEQKYRPLADLNFSS